MAYANKFLSNGEINISDGSTVLYGSKIGAKNLVGTFDTVKIDNNGSLYPAKLDSGDITGVVVNPMTEDLNLNSNNIDNSGNINFSNNGSIQLGTSNSLEIFANNQKVIRLNVDGSVGIVDDVSALNVYGNSIEGNTIVGTLTTPVQPNISEVGRLIINEELTITEQNITTEGGQIGLKMSDGTSKFYIDVAGGVTNQQNLRFLTTSPAKGFVLTHDGKMSIGADSFFVPSLDLSIGSANTGINYSNTNELTFLTNNAEVMKLLQDGRISVNNNLGIGDDNPTNRLSIKAYSQINDNFTTFRIQREDSTHSLNFGLIGSANANEAGYFIDSSQIGVSDNRPLTLQRFGGNLGIGTSEPSEKLHVDGNALIDGDISIKNTSTVSGSKSILSLGQSDSTGNRADLTFFYEGNNNVDNRLSMGYFNIGYPFNFYKDGLLNIGVTKTAPTSNYKLNVVGDSYLDGFTFNTGDLEVGSGLNLYVDTTNNRVGVNGYPDYDLDVNGDINFTSTLKRNDVDYLNSNTLGTPIINSSLQNLGVQNEDLDMGNNNIINVGEITSTSQILGKQTLTRRLVSQNAGIGGDNLLYPASVQVIYLDFTRSGITNPFTFFQTVDFNNNLPQLLVEQATNTPAPIQMKRITVTESGLYYVKYHVDVLSTQSGAGFFIAQILKNGSANGYGRSYGTKSSNNTGDVILNGADLLQLSSTEFIELEIDGTNGTQFSVVEGSISLVKMSVPLL